MKAAKYCDICNSEEGKVRPVGNYVVKLTKHKMDDFVFSVCQGCFRKAVRNSKKQTPKTMKNNIKDRITFVLRKVFGILLLMVICTIVVQAQGLPGPPGFPTTPTDAPIDGGLSLLAAAGGAYAIKKLRDKNK